MSEQQPTGVTVYHDGEATNYPTATDAVTDRGELLVHRINPDADHSKRVTTLAIWRHWDAVDIHESSPAKSAVILGINGEVIGRLVDERIAEHARRTDRVNR